MKYLKYIIAAFLLLLFLKWFDVVGSLKSLKYLELTSLIVAFLIYALAQILRATRFYVLTNKKINYFRNLVVHFISPLLSRVTPGKIGEVSKVFMIGGKKEDSIFSHIIERFMDIIALLILASIVLLFYRDIAWIFVIFVLLLAIGCAIVWNSDKLFNFILKFFSKKKLNKDWFKNKFYKMRKDFVIISFVLSFLNWIITATAFFILSKSLGIDISYPIFIAIVSASIIIGIVSGLPGGVGAREFGLTLLLVRFGVAHEIASVFALVFLAFFLLSESIFALFGFLIYKITFPK